MSSEDANAREFRDAYHTEAREVAEFDALMESENVREPTFTRLHDWVEEHLLGRVLDLYERKLRGMQGRN